MYHEIFLRLPLQCSSVKKIPIKRVTYLSCYSQWRCLENVIGCSFLINDCQSITTTVLAPIKINAHHLGYVYTIPDSVTYKHLVAAHLPKNVNPFCAYRKQDIS